MLACNCVVSTTWCTTSRTPLLPQPEDRLEPFRHRRPGVAGEGGRCHGLWSATPGTLGDWPGQVSEDMHERPLNNDRPATFHFPTQPLTLTFLFMTQRACKLFANGSKGGRGSVEGLRPGAPS